MAASLQQIRTLTIQAREEGIAQVKAKLDELSRAQVQVGETSDTSAKKQASAASAFKRIEGALDGETAAARKLVSQLNVLERAHAQGQGGDEARQSQLRTAAYVEYGLAVERAKKQEAVRTSAANDIAGVGNAARLTSSQMLNLSRQGNDVVTMFALGASPMQVFASQAGQVYDALESGPKGLRGSLSAVGEGLKSGATAALGFVTPMGLVAAGATAAAAAIIYFGDNTEKNIKRAEDAADSYVETLKRIRSAQGDVSGAANSIFSEERLTGGGTTAAQIQLEVLRQQAARKGLVENLIQTPLSSGSAMNPLGDATELFRQLTGGTSKGGLAGLAASIEDGSMKASQLEEILFKLRLSPDLPSDLGTVVDEMIKGATAAADVEARIDAVTGAVARLRIETIRGNLKTAAGSLRELVPADPITSRQDVERRYQASIASARLLPEARGAMATADADRQKALDEIGRQESVLRAGRDLDLRAIDARTVAEKSLIAAERERLALSGQNLEESEKSARIAAASAQVLAQANREATDALHASTVARDAAGLEGYAAGVTSIIQRYQEQIDAANGSTDAITKLTQARNLDIQVLQIQTQKSLFGPQQTQLASLTAEAAAIGASDDERRRLIDGMAVEERIRQAGIDSTGAQADAYRQNAKALSDYADRIRRTGEAYDDLRKTGESAIDSLVGSFTSGDFSGALKSIADDFTKTALELAVSNPLKNALLGTSYGTFDDLLSGTGAAPNVKVPGVQAVASMQVTASTVSIGGASLTGAGGAVERLLNPANSNAASGNAIAYRNAIASIESAGSGDYAALGPVTKNGDRAYGRYQMMGANIPSWSKQATGESVSVVQFMADPALQDKIFDKIFGGYVDKYGEAGASQAWFGGPGSVGKAGRKDMLGTSVGGYSQKFEAALGKTQTSLAASSSSLSTSATAFTADFSQVTGQVNAGIGQIADQFLPGFGGVLTKLLNGMQSGADGGGGIGGWLGSLFGGSGGGDAWAGMRTVTAAGGGYIAGPGTGTSDDIPAMLSDGEFVVKASATSRHRALLEAINQGDIRRYAGGGMVGPRIPANLSPTLTSSPRVAVSIQNHTGGQVGEADVKQSQDANGDINIEAIIRPMVRDEVTNPGRRTARNLKQMGVKPGIIRR